MIWCLSMLLTQIEWILCLGLLLVLEISHLKTMYRKEKRWSSAMGLRLNCMKTHSWHLFKKLLYLFKNFSRKMRRNFTWLYHNHLVKSFWMWHQNLRAFLNSPHKLGRSWEYFTRILRPRILLYK
jgi:hypothetical protein